MKSKQSTKEKQYEVMLDYREARGLETLGLMTSQAWYDDPKRLTFTLSRYKFAAKMLSGMKSVLEVGCADAFATRIVAQEVENLTVTDFDELFIKDVLSRSSDKWKVSAITHDMLEKPFTGDFDGIYALDVLEHILPENEDKFIENMIHSLKQYGVLVIGMPTLESQDYASPLSKEGHVNCKSMPDLKAKMQEYFHNVFMFCMNDEVVHTGYHKMAHYIFSVACNKRKT